MPTPCPGCRKLAALETSEPEVNSEDISGGSVTAEVRVVRTSACCSEDMKEYTFNLEVDVTEELQNHANEKHRKAHVAPCPTADDAKSTVCTCDDVDIDEMAFTLELGDAENTDRTQTHDRRGKPLKGPMRYRKTYLGVSVEYTVRCDECSEDVATGTLTDEVQASEFEELN